MVGRPGLFFANENAATELLTGPDAILAVVRAALAGKAAAQEFQEDLTGAHDARIFAGGYEERDWGDGPTATCYFGSFSGTWHLMEYGSANNPPFRPLTRAAEAIGIEFEPR